MPVPSISVASARRIAVTGALLAEPAPRSVAGAVAALGKLQLDPTNVVARAERLVLFSRLGPYDVADLDRDLWKKRRLFEYWAFIVPMADFGLHRETMRRYPPQQTARGRMVRRWLAANAGFRRYILSRLRREGPLPSREFEDRSAVPWITGGWNDDKNKGRMLETLWAMGAIATAGRDGGERMWDLAERRLPLTEPRLAEDEVARRILERGLRVRGIARMNGFGFAFDGRPPGWQRAWQRLLHEGVAAPVRIEGAAGGWYAHRDVVEAANRFRPRTTVLCPFDPLIKDRKRTEDLFGFQYRIEIYVPKKLRRYGYYVLPILQGNRLIGRLDPQMNRETGTLTIHSLHAEPRTSAGDGHAVAEAITGLAEWLNASAIALPRSIPAPWKPDLRSVE
ncbi:MAG: winged helix-turn-helix domain-containing protein [Actinomycetota bacterium]